jgi:hypothetical protein
MPISILDYVKSKTGDKETYTAEDFSSNGVTMLGGCETCGVTIAAYNAYPSKSGYWRCADCIGDHGFTTLTEFEEFAAHAIAERLSIFKCLYCGEADNTASIPVLTEDGIQDLYLCGECGETWQ